MFRFFFSPSLLVAPLHPYHAFAMAQLHEQGFAQGWDEAEFERMLCDRTHIGHGLFAKGKAEAKLLCGFVLSRLVADEGEILTLVLGIKWRGRNASRPLLETHLAELARDGAAHLHLEVEETNAPALALYRRMGFTRTGRRSAYYHKLDGTRADALVMSRIL
jgi:[ribosomal protein S18]-alanine N-acetyltransferase